MLAARVLPDVSGFDRDLDYSVSPSQAEVLRAGSIVRVPLQGRKVRGWVLAFPVEPEPGLVLRPVENVVGYGPEPELLELADWAAWMWAGRRRHLLSTANPARSVRDLPSPSPARVAPAQAWWADLIARARPGLPHVVVVAPAQPVTDLVLAVAQRGPVLVLSPTTSRAAAGADAFRRRGAGVALLPDEWEQARAGAGIVIGSRAAAWGPCPGLAGVVVLDAHEESYAQEQAPTWWAPSVAAERARRAGAPCFWVSASPTLEMLAGAQHPPIEASSRSAWPTVRTVDLRDEDPRTGLLTGPLVSALRAAPGRAVCVLNRKGRAQLLACSACGEVARCEACRGAVTLGKSCDAGQRSAGGVGQCGEELACRRCSRRRPVVCGHCGSDNLKLLRPGIGRVREQLEALLGVPVAEVSAGTGPVPSERVVVGTEAVLHRVSELRRGGEVGLIAFLDMDQELLAPRYRAAEEALALLVRAARALGPRRPGACLLVQTRLPEHPVLRAAASGRPEVALQGEDDVRRALHLPPHSALALISGEAAPGFAERLSLLLARAPYGSSAPDEACSFALLEAGGGRWLLRAPDQRALADLLAQAGRPEGRARVEVGPVRL